MIRCFKSLIGVWVCKVQGLIFKINKKEHFKISAPFDTKNDKSGGIKG